MAKVVIGVDPHKRINAVVVVNAKGKVLGREQFENTSSGFRELRTFANRWRPRTWAVEGCNGVGKHLAQRLVAEGERVVDVSTRRAALVRVFAGGNGRKNDDTDAYSIALVGLQTPDLPEVVADDRTAALRLLANRRHELVGLRTQAVCRIHRDLVTLFPGGAPRALTAKSAKQLLATTRPRDEVGRLRRRLIAEQIADLVAIDKRLAQLEAEIKALVAETPTGLMRLFGVGPVTTARVLGEVGDVARFRSRHHFASYNGTAPVDASSGGGPPVYRLNIKGNRKLNHAIHMVAITQIRNDCAGRDFYRRKIREGKTPKEAVRALKRRISDSIYRQLLEDAARQRDPGGQAGTTPKTSVTDLTPMAGSSVKPQPGSQREPTPLTVTA
ncbi:MAG TPA: IS110 family transposase [Acidimicrobiales bacterium]|jgi:transposase|nr:IS110 family transposase [Acidimicrobiales bacterium]